MTRAGEFRLKYPHPWHADGAPAEDGSSLEPPPAVCEWILAAVELRIGPRGQAGEVAEAAAIVAGAMARFVNDIAEVVATTRQRKWMEKAAAHDALLRHPPSREERIANPALWPGPTLPPIPE